MDKQEEKLSIKGKFRIYVTDKDDNVVNDLGWKDNVVMDLGILDYFINSISGISTLSIGYCAIGYGTAPVHTDTSLNGEIIRAAVTTTILSNKLTQFAVQFSTTDFDIILHPYINNIGLFDMLVGGTMFCGSSYSTITLFPDQKINVQYQVGTT